VVHIPGKWEFEIAMLGDRININHAEHLGTDMQVHGVLGHTLNRTIPVDHTGCNSYEEGGCEVDGIQQDYEVLGDLCSTVWTYGKFSPQSCSNF